MTGKLKGSKGILTFEPNEASRTAKHSACHYCIVLEHELSLTLGPS